MAQLVKNLPGMWETWLRLLSWGDPLEKGMATHSSIRLPTPVFCPGEFHGLIVHGVSKSQTFHTNANKYLERTSSLMTLLVAFLSPQGPQPVLSLSNSNLSYQTAAGLESS